MWQNFPLSGRGRAGDAMDQVTPVVEIALGTVPLIVSLFIHGIGMGIVQRVFRNPRHPAISRARATRTCTSPR